MDCLNQRAIRSAELVLVLLLLLCLPFRQAVSQSSETDTATKVRFGGFLDAYYAFDFNRPRLHDRAFTTQAARHNEFNVNLAFIDASLSGPRLRGRVAVQFGTSVQANYASEPDIGVVSGSDVSRFLQEAVVGYKLTPHLWIDAGVFLSSFGSENWTSRDNWTYTRSLVAENSPYYESGVKATWQVSKLLSAQVHLINGWQNVSENNSDKAIGARVDYAPSTKVNLSYDAFIGNEVPDSANTSTRIWQEGILTLLPGSRIQIRGTVDYGIQHDQSVGSSSWWGYSLIGRYTVSRKLNAAIRTEHYADKNQIIIATNLPYGFRASGWSVNADFEPVPRLLWRLEFRELDSRSPVFPAAKGNLARRDRMAVGSVALTF